MSGEFDKYEVSDTMSVTTCCTCGVVFGLPNHLNHALRRNGRAFYCPNGHELHYTDGMNLEEWVEHGRRLATELRQHKLGVNQARFQRDQLEAKVVELEALHSELRAVARAARSQSVGSTAVTPTCCGLIMVTNLGGSLHCQRNCMKSQPSSGPQ